MPVVGSSWVRIWDVCLSACMCVLCVQMNIRGGAIYLLHRTNSSAVSKQQKLHLQIVLLHLEFGCIKVPTTT